MATGVARPAVAGLLLAWLAFSGASQVAPDAGAAQAADPGDAQAADPAAELVARYREAARRSDDALDWYNLGTSLLRARRWEEATEALERTAGARGDRVRSFGRYNYGLASALAGRRGEGDAQAGRGSLVEARDAFRDVLRADPRDEDARWNLEVVQRWLQERPPGAGGSSGPDEAPAGGGGAGLPQGGGDAGRAVELGTGEAEALLDAAGRAEGAVRDRLLGRARLRDPVVERNW